VSTYLIYVMRRCEHCGQDAEHPISLIQLLDNPYELDRVLNRECDEVSDAVDDARNDLLYARSQADRLVALGVRSEFVADQLHQVETKIEERVAMALRIQPIRT
jgi:hypothetical protein